MFQHCLFSPHSGVVQVSEVCEGNQASLRESETLEGAQLL